jgi:hypothetical protein
LNNIPEPLKSVLRDYCHVEWFEIDELTGDVANRCQAFDAEALQTQFREAISSGDIPFLEINDLTSNEFESAAAAKAWLEDIYRHAFARR